MKLTFDNVKNTSRIVRAMEAGFKYGWEPEWRDICEAWGVSERFEYNNSYRDAYNQVLNTAIFLKDAQLEETFKSAKKGLAEKKIRQQQRRNTSGCIVPIVAIGFLMTLVVCAITI